ELGNKAVENHPPGHYRRNDRRPVSCAPARIWILLPDMPPRLCRNEFCLKDRERRLSSGLIPGAQGPPRTAGSDVRIRKGRLNKSAALAWPKNGNERAVALGGAADTKQRDRARAGT